jgi:heme-degrading monooxygenase HmoA
MISRQWRGLARSEAAQAYEAHLIQETFPALRKIEGFVDASILKRIVETGVEFLVVTRWSSLEAIAKFSGSDLEAAVVPDKVQRMMVEYDRRVKHYEVVK